MPDVSHFGSYIPPGSAFILQSGEVEVGLATTFEPQLATGSGSLSVAGRGLEGSLGGLDLRFDLELEVPLSDADFQSGTVRLDGSRLRLDGVHHTGRSEGGKSKSISDWWARVRLPQATVRQVETTQGDLRAEVSGRLEAELRDSSLVLELMTQRVPRLAWLDHFLEVPDVEAGGEVTLGADWLDLRDFLVQGGDHIELQAEVVRRQPAAPQGVFFARYRKLSAAVAMDLNGEGRDWKLIRSRDWYRDTVERFRRRP